MKKKAQTKRRRPLDIGDCIMQPVQRDNCLGGFCAMRLIHGAVSYSHLLMGVVISRRVPAFDSRCGKGVGVVTPVSRTTE